MSAPTTVRLHDGGAAVRPRVPVLDEAAALAAAHEVATAAAPEAARRDAERELPRRELDLMTRTGLLAATVPAAYGGAGLSTAGLAEAVRVVAAADPCLAQLPHSHFVYVNALRHAAQPDQQAFFFDEVLSGARFGNAQSELRTKHGREHATTLTPDADGGWRLDGVKGYATGALLADWIPVLAHLGTDGPMHVAWVERRAEGVRVVDDWDGMGQRTTASGVVHLDGVHVAADRVTGYHLTFTGPQTYGAFAQVLHAAIDAGIARAALTEAATFVRERSRPHADAGVDRAADDPLVVHALGEVDLAVRGAEALLAEAARAVDAADADLTAHSAGEASLAVAAARAATTAASLEASTRLFEVAGTRSAADSLNLHRHWRNARTHTLHDPAAWKVQHLGRHVVDGVLPPSHGQL